MLYLVLKIFLMLLLATLLGAALAWWWFRRQYEDVTADYSRWNGQFEQWRHRIDERTATLAAVDLTPVLESVEALRRGLASIRFPLPERTDLSPVMHALADLRLPEAQPLDISPLLHRLAALEEKLEMLRPAGAPPPAPPAPPATLAAQEPVIRDGSRNLLQHPAYGPPDDLKRIVGVGQGLEGMLHRIGVFYFWQVAEWTAQDIADVDAQLKAFKGRIQRDQWVAQCAEFAREPDAARRPGN